jgi:hypothetical protein
MKIGVQVIPHDAAGVGIGYQAKVADRFLCRDVGDVSNLRCSAATGLGCAFTKF